MARSLHSSCTSSGTYHEKPRNLCHLSPLIFCNATTKKKKKTSSHLPIHLLDSLQCISLGPAWVIRQDSLNFQRTPCFLCFEISQKPQPRNNKHKKLRNTIASPGFHRCTPSVGPPSSRAPPCGPSQRSQPRCCARASKSRGEGNFLL